MALDAVSRLTKQLLGNGNMPRIPNKFQLNEEVKIKNKNQSYRSFWSCTVSCTLHAQELAHSVPVLVLVQVHNNINIYRTCTRICSRA